MQNLATSNDHSTTTRISSRLKKIFALVAGAAALGGFASAQTPGTFQVTNLLSDGSVPALTTDPNFLNPWGVSIGKDFWINTQATGLDYVALIPGATSTITAPQIPFTVGIPAAGGVKTTTGTPTGTVFYAGKSFLLPNGAPPSFLFSTLDGTVSGWNIGLGTKGSVAQVAIDNSAANAVYTDMALLTNATGTFLLTANFGQGADVEVYDSSYKAAKLAGSFTDPNVPAGYAPYSVHSIGSQVFVTYMLRTAVSTTTPVTGGPAPYLVSPKASNGVAYQQTLGAGNGFLDVFDNNGNFVARAVDTGGNLNSPWGVAIAPATFGVFGGDLLVGNFGDGHINVYDPKTFAFLGQMTDGTGKSISYPGMWELVFGTGTAGYGDVNTLFFSAGLNNEKDGLFASITNNATSTAPATFGVSASTTASSVKAGAAAKIVVAVAPTNSFSGNVTLSCSGLPTGATCTFSPAQLSVSSTQSATSTVTIQTAAATASVSKPEGFTATRAAEIAAAMLLPFGSLLAFVRRRPVGKSSMVRLLGLVAIMLVASGMIAGCSSGMTAAATPPPVTPTAPVAATSQVTITATAGSTVQSTTVALTVQ
ncbi:TIGR03118 family protein [Granulicella arctica]|uniref:TIGR03118 family protein n=1 Tax=Granulicella arctica TaxID=940613 RepID=UPI0021E0AF63|nr:TIGR03118 family protein [Granulicella arctica]